jgi:hypothetical protein
MVGRSKERNRYTLLLIGLCLLAACASPAPDPYAYTSPERTPYDSKPLLKEQYLKAHRAAWDNQLSQVSLETLEKALRGEGVAVIGVHQTCCEATPNVTRGWYRGQQDGSLYLQSLAEKTDRAGEVLANVRRLKSEIEAHPVADWYVADSHRPGDLVKVEEQGGAVVKVYRDASKTKLFEVRQMKGAARHGRCEEYDVNGALRTVSTWVDGVREGESLEYLDSGELCSRTQYRGDKPEGRELWYGEDGLLNYYGENEAGRLQGLQVRWNEAGRPEQVVHWKAGARDGRCVTYLEDTARVELYKDGEKVGDSSDPIAPDALPHDEKPATLNRLREQFRR